MQMSDLKQTEWPPRDIRQVGWALACRGGLEKRKHIKNQNRQTEVCLTNGLPFGK